MTPLRSETPLTATVLIWPASSSNRWPATWAWFRPLPGFLEGLREITSASGTLLIFDEVITGFRVAYGGWQNLAGITPDLTCLGKIIGGGLPSAPSAAAGRSWSSCPPGPVYQAGTLSGKPLAMAAGSPRSTSSGRNHTQIWKN